MVKGVEVIFVQQPIAVVVVGENIGRAIAIGVGAGGTAVINAGIFNPDQTFLAVGQAVGVAVGFQWV